MRRDWLIYLVIFSLALNLGTIGTFAYLRHRDQKQINSQQIEPPLPLRTLWHELKMDEAQRQSLRSLFPDHRQKVRALRQELAQRRQELSVLFQEDAPAWEVVEAKIKQISHLQESLEQEMARFLLAFKKNLKPEQHTAFLSLVQTRLGCPPEGRGGFCGPRGSHHGGLGRMRVGPGGPPPECPR